MLFRVGCAAALALLIPRGLLEGAADAACKWRVEKLREAGVDIARRTVAKYREAMRIPSSVQRRREKPQMPPHQAVARLDRHPAQARLAPVDHAKRQDLHPGPVPVPGMTRHRVTPRPTPSRW